MTGAPPNRSSRLASSSPPQERPRRSTRTGHTPFEFLQRHVSGDWGDLDDEDRQLNDQALIDGSRLLSAYRLADGTKIWLITEAVGENGRRESSTFLLPYEY